MYCLQWLMPVLLLPKHWLHPSLLLDQALFMWFYLIGFFLERRPCYVCSLVFVAALGVLCWRDPDTCVFWPFCTTRLGGEICGYVFEREIAPRHQGDAQILGGGNG